MHVWKYEAVQLGCNVSFPSTLPWIDVGSFVLVVCGGDNLTDELISVFHHYVFLTSLTNEYVVV
jgi:hypothetical protein